MYAEVQLLQDNEPVLALPPMPLWMAAKPNTPLSFTTASTSNRDCYRLGRSAGDWMEVLSGVSEGDEVVTSANFLIDSESRLKAAIAGYGWSDRQMNMRDHGK